MRLRVRVFFCIVSVLTLFLVIVILRVSLNEEVFIMAFRKKIGRKKSKRQFTKGATRVHRRNVSGRPMRGGIRL